MNARRRSACRPSGVTTPTFTAVSLPAATARTAMPTSAPAAARGRHRPRPGRPSSSFAGPAGVDQDLRASQPGRAAQQPDQRAAGPGLDRRERPAAPPERLLDRARPGRVAARPDELAERRLDGCLGLVGERRVADARRLGARRDPDVDRLLPRVGRHDRVGGAQQRLAQALGDLRLADPGQPQRAHLGLDADPARRPASAAPRRPTSAASRAAVPGRVTITRPSGRLDQPARRRAVGVRQDRRRRDASTPACG